MPGGRKIFTSLMHELGIKITYESNKETDEIITLVTIGDETLTLQEYLKDKRFFNDSKHAHIRKMY